jgi:hypothetical protein
VGTRHVYLELHDNKRMDTATAFLENTLAQYPFKIEKILTDNGMESSYNPLPDGKKPRTRSILRRPVQRPAGRTPHLCPRSTTLVKHPWTNGMVRR